MKAIIINDDIKIYQELPKSWGNVIGGFNLLSDEQLQSYGFYDVVKPDHDSKVEILSNLHFDADNNIFTYEVNDKNWSALSLSLITTKSGLNPKVLTVTLLGLLPV